MACYHPATLLLYEDIRGNKKTRFYSNRDMNLVPLSYHEPLKIENPRGFFDVYNFVKEYSVPCGKCVGCQKDRAKVWSMRLMAEYKTSINAYFITLTYDEEHLPKNNQVNKKELQKFFKSLKDFYRYNFNYFGIRYFAVGEYGSNSWRPHYHFIVYNIPLDSTDFELFNIKVPKNDFLFRLREREQSSSGVLFESLFLRKLWNKGINRIGRVSIESCSYVARYCNKKINRDIDIKKALESINFQPEFMICSKNLGKNWYLQNTENLLNNNLKMTFQGKIVGVPRYFKEYCLTNEEKERAKKIVDKNSIAGADSYRSKNCDHNQDLALKESLAIQDSKKLHRD